jgi:hypothetical protein
LDKPVQDLAGKIPTHAKQRLGHRLIPTQKPLKSKRLANPMGFLSYWYTNCSLGASHCKKPTERDNMETPVTNECFDIFFNNAIYPAAICHRCCTKIYPASSLEAHLDRHQLKDLFLEGELKKLQYSMGRMR